ncbi:GntP family permease, partial [Bifidobacterium thermophilum]|nr:GntP family permease [Bifidobacterium thermophilum]
DALPGTPQIQNIIPTNYFGTDAYAAPVVGIIGAIMVFVGGMLWLERRRKQAIAKGEGYGTGHKNEPEQVDEKTLPSFWLSILPLVIVIALNFI